MFTQSDFPLPIFRQDMTPNATPCIESQSPHWWIQNSSLPEGNLRKCSRFNFHLILKSLIQTQIFSMQQKYAKIFWQKIWA